MTAAAKLEADQFRAIAIVLGSMYVFYAARGVVVQFQVRPEIAWGPVLVSALAWVPGVVSLPLFVWRRLVAARAMLRLGVFTYPVTVLLWPLVAVPDAVVRLDFWIHSMAGLPALAALMTLPRILAWAALVINCALVEGVMRLIGIVTTWDATLVRLAYAWVYAAFYFILLSLMLADITRTNRLLERSAQDQAEAARLRARDEEIDRLDRLTHDFVLSLLSGAAEGVPTDKLRVQAETARRRLVDARLEADEIGSATEMVDRIVQRCAGYGVPVTGTVSHLTTVPQLAAIEIEAAVEEAVRNSVHHAMGGAEVTIADEGAGVTIRVRDDGPGFDPAELGERLGVTQSILHRMNTLPGGSAVIDSAPEHPTMVTVTWSAP